jgi:hypothetical protein
MPAFELYDVQHNVLFLSITVGVLGLVFIIGSAVLHRWRKRRERVGQPVLSTEAQEAERPAEGQAIRPATRQPIHLAAVIVGDILRDVGIAFLVAIVVTIVYEMSTRANFEGAKMQHVLKTVLAYDVPSKVWDELNDNILHRPVIRRKVNIVFRVEKDPSFFANLARLRMDYSYYLYSFSDSSIITVQHDVVGHMTFRDYPRFESVSVTEPGKGPDTYDRARLQRENMLKSFQRKIYFEPAYNFATDSYDDAKAARIETIRDEVVSLPGVYPLGIPELIEGPIDVIVQAQEGMEPEISTQWSQHVFGLVSTHPLEDNYTEYKYTFKGTLLPGQTILLLFKVLNSPMPPMSHDEAQTSQ